MANFLQDASSNGEQKRPSQQNKESGITFKIPTAENPLVVKFLYNPWNPSQSGIELEYFPHKIGPSDKDSRSHPCRQSLGLGKSPEMDEFWRLNSEIKEVKERVGKNFKENAEYQKLDKQRKKFRPKKGGYVFFIEPNNPRIQALKVGPMVFNRLFGKAATEHRPAVPSLVKQMASKGENAFLTADKEKNKTGWVKIWKTGEKLGTEYHLEPVVGTEKVEVKGKKMDAEFYVEHDVAPEINEMIDTLVAGEEFDLKNIPNPIEFEKKQAWTEEESLNFVEAQGDLAGVPERLVRGSNSGSSTIKDGDDYPENNNTSFLGGVASETPEASQSVMDDIPF